jgi:hypothetical protein
MAKRTCSVDGCEEPHYGRGWCRRHYHDEYRRGLTPLPKPSPSERFWTKVDKTADCWNWTGYIDRQGYGKFRLDGKAQLAHRVSYTWLAGEIPDGLQIDHLCRNRRCVNPSHLEPVTPRVNVRRSAKADITHCVHGHEYTPENTLYQANGTRKCHTCYLAYQRRRYWERKAETT